MHVDVKLWPKSILIHFNELFRMDNGLRWKLQCLGFLGNILHCRLANICNII